MIYNNTPSTGDTTLVDDYNVSRILVIPASDSSEVRSAKTAEFFAYSVSRIDAVTAIATAAGLQPFNVDDLLNGALS